MTLVIAINLISQESLISGFVNLKLRELEPRINLFMLFCADYPGMRNVLLHYPYKFYPAVDLGKGGLIFSEAYAPIFWDFMFFAVVLSMTLRDF